MVCLRTFTKRLGKNWPLLSVLRQVVSALGQSRDLSTDREKPLAVPGPLQGGRNCSFSVLLPVISKGSRASERTGMLACCSLLLAASVCID